MHITGFSLGLIFLTTASALFAQNTTVSGYVKDAKNGEALDRCIRIYTTSPRYGGVPPTAYGFYSLTHSERLL